jgi:uncharacterized protein (TIGR03067 family)
MKKLLVIVLIILAAITVFFLARNWTDDLDGLAGDGWVVTAVEDHGKKFPVERFPVKGIQFTKDVATWIVIDEDGQPAQSPGEYKFDSSKSPKEIDLEMPNGVRLPGIYEIKGDELRICVDRARPKNFSGTSHMVWTFKR